LRSLSNEYSCALGAQINFGDLTQYITYGLQEDSLVKLVSNSSQKQT
jgi:hypothetical protein